MRKTPLVLFLSIACAASCVGPSTSFEQVWRGQQAELDSVQNVVTLYESEDGAMRRNVEDAMARKLAMKNVRAVPAYTLLEGKEIEDRDAVKAKLQAAGFDGVVVIRIIGTEMYPGDTTYTTWGPGWPMAYEDYVFSSPVVRVETTLYSLRADQLVWSARSKTVDAEDTNDVIEEVTSLVATTLQRQGVGPTSTARR